MKKSNTSVMRSAEILAIVLEGAPSQNWQSQELEERYDSLIDEMVVRDIWHSFCEDHGLDIEHDADDVRRGRANDGS